MDMRVPSFLEVSFFRPATSSAESSMKRGLVDFLVRRGES